MCKLGRRVAGVLCGVCSILRAMFVPFRYFASLSMIHVLLRL
jgi:hypothetical protein